MQSLCHSRVSCLSIFIICVNGGVHFSCVYCQFLCICTFYVLFIVFPGSFVSVMTEMKIHLCVTKPTLPEPQRTLWNSEHLTATGVTLFGPRLVMERMWHHVCWVYDADQYKAVLRQCHSWVGVTCCRRANLRRSLDRLKGLVPLSRNETRHTTLGLLENAQTFIRVSTCVCYASR